MVLTQIMDPIMSPLLKLHPLLAVAIVSLFVAIIITVIYKFTTNQDLMKRLKTELKELQAEMKELREHPEEAMKVQKEMMDTNMKYMGQSMKSTLYTFIPIILIFGWMNAHFMYEPITPEEQFQVTLNFQKGSIGTVVADLPESIEAISDLEQDVTNDKVTYTLKGKEGIYNEGNSLKFEYDERVYFKDIIITNEQEYTKKEEQIKNSNIKSISINYNKKIILPLINWGWLGTYIIFSIIFSSTLRKLMKVY